MNDKKGKLFCCFSVPLRDFLIKQGIEYEVCALNEKTKKTMWIYIRTKELNRELDTWRLNKPC